MTGFHVRADQDLHSALSELARAEGLSLNAFICRTLRADVNRRTRLCLAAGLHWRASDAEIAERLAAAAAQPLTAVERGYLPDTSPSDALEYAARRGGSKPAPNGGSKPPAQRSAAARKETEREELERLRRESGYSLPTALRRRTRSGMGSSSFWLLSGEALQQRVVRSIREARTPLTARAPAPAQGATSPLTVENGVAYIRVEGVLTPAPDLMASYYDEPNTTYPALQDALAKALSTSGVNRIVWSIDSPGGSVDGLFALLDDIEDARGRKPMSVLADNAHSAAYGIAAAVGRITASSRTASFGSVGVATSGFIQGGLCGTVIDLTNSDSPEKRPDLATAEGKAVVTRYLDQIAGEFMGSIARGRGVALGAVRTGYGRGSSMLAKAALEAKLIDGIAGRSR